MLKYMVKLLLLSGALYAQPNEVELPTVVAPTVERSPQGHRSGERLGMTKAEQAEAAAISHARVQQLQANAELILGAFDQDVKRINKALDAGADINVHGDYHGYTPLIILATRAKVDPIVFKFLLYKPHIDLNAYDEKGMTALHHAAQEGNVKVVDLLVHGDAALHNRDQSGKTPLDLIAAEIKKNGQNQQFVARLRQVKQIIEDKDDLEKNLEKFSAIPQEEIESQINLDDDKWHVMNKKLEEFRSSPEHMARYTPAELELLLGKEEKSPTK